MAAELPLERVLASVSDGASVDWDAVDRAVPDDDARELLRCLRELAEVAEAHRQFSAEASCTADAVAPSATAMEASFARALTALAAADDSAPVGGRPWGRFTLREKLGEGSFGAVYRAWDPQLERHIAIKLIHPDIARRDAPGTRVLREGRVVAKVKHENVVTVFGVESHDDQVGLCMEYVEGCTLDDVVRRQGPLRPAEAAVVGQRVCAALAAVHAADLVHRDVKARNVMREDATGRIVLMDFGSGLKLQPGKETSVPIAGTPLYMAPEVLLGDPPSPRSDVYSVGVLLYYLTSLQFPIEGTSLDEIREAHRRGDRRFLTERCPEVPAAFARLVERALDANPANRQSNAASLLHDLTTLTGNAEPRVARTPRLAAAAAFVRAHGVSLSVTVLVAAVGVWLLGFLSSQTYNRVLDVRGAFALESPWSWFRWGLKGLVAPGVLAASLAFCACVAVELLRVARKVSPRVDFACYVVSRRLHAVLNRTGYSPTTALAVGTVTLSVLFLGAAYFFLFADLAGAVGASVTTATDRQLALLSPSNREQHVSYRYVFTIAVTMMTAGWFAVWRLARDRHEGVPPTLVGAGIASMLLALILLDHPYRILWQNRAERVVYGTSTCYIISEVAGRTQLLCPLESPRKKVVSGTDENLVRSGELENVFLAFSQPLIAQGP